MLTLLEQGKYSVIILSPAVRACSGTYDTLLEISVAHSQKGIYLSLTKFNASSLLSKTNGIWTGDADLKLV